ncbi:MAG: hypothetical protein SF187_03280 [Deltaproteobacteria bacterium]|nr:hypothetical protein [Deltaproteobacteria bacterium]
MNKKHPQRPGVVDFGLRRKVLAHIAKKDRVGLRSLLQNPEAVAACLQTDSGYPIGWNAVVSANDAEMAKILIDCGAVNLAAQNERWYWGPLIHALFKPGRADIVRVLLDAGAGRSEVMHGDGPLWIAARSCPDAVPLLVAAGFEWPKRTKATILSRCLEGAVHCAEFFRQKPDKDVRSNLSIFKKTVKIFCQQAQGQFNPQETKLLAEFAERTGQAGAGAALAQDPFAQLGSEESVAQKNWEKKVRKHFGPVYKKRETLEKLARATLSSEFAVQHKDWPTLVLELLDLSETYRAATKRELGKALKFGADGDAGMFDAWGDGAFVTTDLVGEILSTKHALAHPEWGTLMLAALHKGVACDFMPNVKKVLATSAAKKHPDFKKMKSVLPS